MQASAVCMRADYDRHSVVKNLKAVSLASSTYILPQFGEEIEHNSTKGVFVLKSNGEECKGTIKISEAVPADKAHFPDDAFRGYVHTIAPYYIIPKNPLGVEDGNVEPLYIYDNTTTIKNISAWDKGITSLKGIEYLPHVQNIYCQNNSLTSLDLSKNKELKNLDCSNNQLTTLKLPTSAPLASISCYNNKLTSLNLVSFSSTLQKVYCSDNALTSLTLPSSASQLTTVECWNNKLTSLKMPTDATNLETLYCYGNKIYGDATTQFVNSLPQRSGSKEGVEFVDHSNANEGNRCTPANCITAESRGWILQHNDGTGWKQTNGCPHYFNLTYKVDGEEYRVLRVLEGTTITPIAAPPTKKGYTFSGWKNVPTTMPSKDVVVTGTFTVNKYTLTYVVDGKIYSEQTVTYGDSITLLSNPRKLGFTFSGWSVEALPKTMPAFNIEITGSFIINQYTLTYVVDGEVYAVETLDYGALITPREPPVKEGYTFSGWSEIPHRMLPYDVTITGTFTTNQYTVTFYVDGEEYTSQTLNYGDPIIAPDAPIKEGSTFSGWSEIPATMPARNVAITATFAANPHTVTFYIDNEIFSTSILGYGAEIQLPEVPDKVGYTFGGWKDVATTMPDHDLEYHAWYEAISYNLTYYVGGVIYKITSMKYGDPITHEEDPEDDDYFYAWEDEPTIMPAHDVDVHAVITSIAPLLSGGAGGRPVNVYYDLQGHKVTNPVKGKIYIVNKKKVIYK